jgi:hypothetical protein
MKKELIIASILLFLLVIPLSSAAPPFLTSSTTNNGLIITTPSIDVFKQGNNYTFYWYVQNETSGAFMTNATLSCALEWYKGSLTGLHSADIKGTFDGVEEFSAYLNADNFSMNGLYAKRIKCNSTAITGVGGINIQETIVTPLGVILDMPTASIFIFIALILFIILVLLVYSIFNSQSVVAIIASLCGSYVSAFSLSFVFWYISGSFLWMAPIFEKITYIVWLVLGICFFPFIILICAWIILNQLNMSNQKEKDNPK